MTANARKINAKSVAKYFLLPGIIPRAKELGGSGFGYLAFLMGQVYLAVRLLPPNHPYAQYSNVGTFGLRQVIAAAASNVQFTRNHIDQIIVFGATVVGLVLLVLQFLLFLFMVLSGTAFAQDASGEGPFKSIFKTQYPETDIAFLMLDYVFGVPKIFGSGAASKDPTPFHQGLHALFEFYNLAILLVGALIFVYYIFVVVVETAQTGVPFGKRFSKIYAPFRLIAAIGLLVPLGFGFNTAQYITFYVAKLGSSFATNGWILFNENVDNPMGVKTTSLVAQANAPQIDGLYQFASVYHACRAIYDIYVPTEYGRSGGSARKTVQIKPYVIINHEPEELRTKSYEDLKEYFGNNDFDIILGELVEEKSKEKVNDYCGRITISLSNSNPTGYMGQESGGGAYREGGVLRIEKSYFYTVTQLLSGKDRTITALGERAAHAYVSASPKSKGGIQDFCYKSDVLKDEKSCAKKTPFPPIENIKPDMDAHTADVQSGVDLGIQELRDGLDLKLTDEMAKYGWGGAGMWFNRVAEINGSVTSAIYAAPGIKKWPSVMEDVREKNRQANVQQGKCDTFNPHLAEGKDIKFDKPYDRQIAIATNELYQYWCAGPPTEEAVPRTMTGNAVNDMIGAIFGLNGLFTLYEDTQMNEETHMPEVHPFAALTAIGKSLVENAIRSMGASIAFTLGSGVVGLLDSNFGNAFKNISSIFVTVATLGLSIGFILYYIVPFLPFIHFFFAVGSWVKSIFEAMVGVPLWALAHLRIDGDGFSGQAAASGYFLLLEIFLRPIATIFGLISSMAVFGATVAVLNKIFHFVVANVTGGALPENGGEITTIDGQPLVPLGMIDQFLFTMMYAILIYLIGNACFKMITTIPQGFMRWMGSPVSTFNDNTGDPTENLTQYAAIGGSQMTEKIFGNINQGASTASGLISAIGNSAKGPQQPPPTT